MLSMNSPTGRLWWIDAIKIDEWLYDGSLLLNVYMVIIIVFFLSCAFDYIRSWIVNIVVSSRPLQKLCNKFDRFYINGEK